VGIDTETRDGGLAQGIGPGWVYDLGHLCGVSVAWGGGSIYVPVRHPNTECRPVGEVLEWVEGILRECDCHFFRAEYDLAWMWHEGLRYWPERFHDGYIQAVMLDENHLSYELDDCCARAGVPGKDPRLLEEAARSYGVEPKSGMWRMPARFVGPYAEQDAAATLALSRLQVAQIEDEGQGGAYQTEIALVRVLHDMRLRGIRINEEAADDARRRVRLRRDEVLNETSRVSGLRVSMSDARSPAALGRIFATAGIVCPLTPRTELPSVTKGWLATLEHPLGGLIRQARQFDDLAEKFIGGYIVDNLHRGRVHAEIHQLRDSDGGTRTHRLSYANPPLQQMPVRYKDDDTPEQKEMVGLVRAMFEPEVGEHWFAPDYAGQEPRFLVHLASATGMVGVESMVARYQENPRTDYHAISAGILGWTRKQAKDTNQGIAYGMGADKLARTLGVTEERARELLKTHRQRMPYITSLTEHCGNLARSRGWIRLIDGARCHFDAWQPAGERDRDVWERGIEAARARWPDCRLERAFTYRAANRGCQGGAARQMKRAMVACHREGLLPLVQMHDELGFSFTERRQCEMAVQLMVDAVKLRVPVVVDAEIGRTWGDAKHTLEDVGL
jgi:DNA polymerase-1